MREYIGDKLVGVTCNKCGKEETEIIIEIDRKTGKLVMKDEEE